MARDEQELREMLSAGWVNIQYIKISTGEKRNCTGTTRLDLIPTSALPNGKGSWKKDGYVRYFDLTVNAWRCLTMANVLEYEPNDFLNNLIRA